MIPLREIAHGRSGDKGNHANIAIIAYQAEHYDWICQHVTSEKVKDWFQAWSPSDVERYEAENLLAVNFVIRDVLDGGASASLLTDNQGKTFALSLLQMPIPTPD